MIIKNQKPLRVLHVPDIVGGHPSALAAIERRHGLDSWCVGFGGSPYNYRADERINTRGLHKIIVPFHRARILWRAFQDFDVIHFNFGSTIFPVEKNLAARGSNKLRRCVGLLYNSLVRLIEYRDLHWLKQSGKVIAVTMQGDDARLWGWCRENFQYTPAKEINISTRLAYDNAVWRRLEAFDRSADLIYSLNPDLMHNLPRRAQWFPYAHPDVTEWNYCGVENSSRPLRIVHAPSNQAVKGTKYIIAAVEQLRREQLRFDFRMVEGLTNAEARRIYEEADVLIDQLLCGWYGGVSAELMALGKVVICYLREEDFRFLPNGMAQGMPLLNANPDNIAEVLRHVISMPRSELMEKGRQSRAWVEKWHNPDAIAAQIQADYSGIRDRQAAV